MDRFSSRKLGTRFFDNPWITPMPPGWNLLLCKFLNEPTKKKIALELEPLERLEQHDGELVNYR